MTGAAAVAHLVRRFVGSLSSRPPAPADEAWVAEQLLAGEAALWHRLAVADRRHSIVVARRFVDRLTASSTIVTTAGTAPSRAEVAAALLHDIGKLDAGLGTVGRVGATLWRGLTGERRATAGTGRISRYLRHEAIGAELLTAAGSDPRTIELVGGRAGGDDPAQRALRWADEI
jgi:hypothetical protein